LNRGISLAGGFETVEDVERLGANFFEADFGIEVKRRLQGLDLEMLARQVIEPSAKGFKVFGRDGEAGGHGVAAMTNEEVAAVAEGGGKVEAGNAAA
jgi:hypothetical protein